MSYEELLLRAIHKAMIDFVDNYRDAGVTGVDLAKDGGLIKTGEGWSLAVHVSRTEPKP